MSIISRRAFFSIVDQKFDAKIAEIDQVFRFRSSKMANFVLKLDFENRFVVGCVLLFSWSLQTVNRPLFAEIVHPDDRGSIFAWDISIESLISAVIAYPALGVLSSQAGYDASRATIADTSKQRRLTNAEALKSAMLPLIVCAWVTVLLLYFYALRRYRKSTFRHLIRTTEREDGDSFFTSSNSSPVRSDEEFQKPPQLVSIRSID
jgi:hypothetical protein